MAILKACFLIRGRTATSLSLALIVNLALAAVEVLFQYRIVRAYHHKRTRLSSIALEGIFIAHLYSILLVLDTISSCVFLKSVRQIARGMKREVSRIKLRLKTEITMQF